MYPVGRMLNLEELNLFVAVAELKSFTAAGEKLDYPKSSISRRLRKLEDQLGTRLLERTTRSISLTEAGELFYERATKILDEVEVTEQLLTGRAVLPSGTLRICAPDELIRLHLQPLLIQFSEEQPSLNLEVITGTVGQHLLGDRLDMMIHIDPPEDSSFCARPVTTATSNYYASPKYLEEYGVPKEPEDLLSHRCVIEQRNPKKNVNHWMFLTESGTEELAIPGHYSADTTWLSRSFVEAGLGISMLPDHSCREALAAGKLIKLFNGKHEITHQLFALYPSRRHMPAKLKVFLEFLERCLPDRL